MLSSLPAAVPERLNQRYDWHKRFMFNDVLRGSRVAFIVGVSLFCLYVKLVPAYYFAAVLAAWTLYSLYRVFAAPLLWMLDVPHVATAWVSANEAAPVGKLCDLNRSQHKYAANRPERDLRSVFHMWNLLNQ